MLNSQQFVDDIAYLAGYYKWNEADLNDVLAQTESRPDEMCRYWTQLAAAHRDGYEQSAANNFIRLSSWLRMQTDGGQAAGDQAVQR